MKNLDPTRTLSNNPIEEQENNMCITCKDEETCGIYATTRAMGKRQAVEKRTKGKDLIKKEKTLKEESEDLTSLFPYYDDLIQDMVSETEKDIEITEVETNDNDISHETDIEQFEPEESLMDGLTPVGKLDTEKDDSDLITKIDMQRVSYT